MKHQGIDRQRVAVVRARLNQMTGEMPSSEGGGGKGGHSDRTGGLAFRHRIDPSDEKRGHLADVAAAAIITLDRLITTITDRARQGLPVTTDLRRLDNLLSDWEPLGEWQTQNLQRQGDDTGLGWCRAHWVAGSHERPRTPGSRLCRWCEDMTRRLNDAGHDYEQPPTRVVEAKARGAKWADILRLLPPGVFEDHNA